MKSVQTYSHCFSYILQCQSPFDFSANLIDLSSHSALTKEKKISDSIEESLGVQIARTHRINPARLVKPAKNIRSCIFLLAFDVVGGPGLHREWARRKWALFICCSFRQDNRRGRSLLRSNVSLDGLYSRPTVFTGGETSLCVGVSEYCRRNTKFHRESSRRDIFRC